MHLHLYAWKFVSISINYATGKPHVVLIKHVKYTVLSNTHSGPRDPWPLHLTIPFFLRLAINDKSHNFSITILPL